MTYLTPDFVTISIQPPNLSGIRPNEGPLPLATGQISSLLSWSRQETYGRECVVASHRLRSGHVHSAPACKEITVYIIRYQ